MRGTAPAHRVAPGDIGKVCARCGIIVPRDRLAPLHVSTSVTIPQSLRMLTLRISGGLHRMHVSRPDPARQAPSLRTALQCSPELTLLASSLPQQMGPLVFDRVEAGDPERWRPTSYRHGRALRVSNSFSARRKRCAAYVSKGLRHIPHRYFPYVNVVVVRSQVVGIDMELVLLLSNRAEA